MLEVLEGEEKQEQLPRLFALSAGDQPEFVQEAMPYQLIALLTLVMLYGQGSTVARLTGREGECRVVSKRRRKSYRKIFLDFRAELARSKFILKRAFHIHIKQVKIYNFIIKNNLIQLLVKKRIYSELQALLVHSTTRYRTWFIDNKN